MMYRKATLFGDEEIAGKFLKEPEAKKQKALGRKVRGFEGGRWDGWREGIVEEVRGFFPILVSVLVQFGGDWGFERYFRRS